MHFLETFCSNLKHIPLQAMQLLEEHLHVSLPAARGGLALGSSTLKGELCARQKGAHKKRFPFSIGEVSRILQETCVLAQRCLSPCTDECELAKSDKNKQTSCRQGRLAAAAGVLAKPAVYRNRTLALLFDRRGMCATVGNPSNINITCAYAREHVSACVTAVWNPLA